MKKLFITIMFVLLGSQASAWVSKGFVPANVSQITVNIDDQASDGCWTNLGEVKRYAEDKLELVGFMVSRNKFEGFVDDREYILNVMVNAKRGAVKCFGHIQFSIVKYIHNNNMDGIFAVGEYGSNFTGSDNTNQNTLRLMGDFMKEVEDPQW